MIILGAGYVEHIDANDFDKTFVELYSYVNIVRQNDVRDKVKAKYMIYETISHAKTKNLCIYQSLIDLGIKIIPDKFKKCTSIEEVIDSINIGELPQIDIYYNYVVNNLPGVGQKEKYHAFDNGRKKCYVCNEVTSLPIIPLKSKNPIGTIIYDSINAHAEAAVHIIPRLLNDLYFRTPDILKMIGNKKVIISGKKSRENDIKQESLVIPESEPIEEGSVFYDNEVFFFFDFEVVSKIRTISRVFPYSISHIMLDGSELRKLSEHDTNYIKEKADRFIDKRAKFHYGVDCAKKAIASLIEFHTQHPEIYIHLIGFNSSNFDNILFMHELESMPLPYEESGKRFVYHGNKLDSFSFLRGKAHFFDIRRHLLGSLADCCKSFSIKNLGKKKDLINHVRVQNIYNSDEENFFENFKNEVSIEDLEEYNKFDVVSLAILFYRYVNTIENLDIIKRLKKVGKQRENDEEDADSSEMEEPKAGKKLKLNRVFEYPTMPSYMYKISKIENINNEVALPDFKKLQDFLDVKGYSIGGRCCTFGKKRIEINEAIMSLDVCSLYPFVMFVYSNGWYPSGNYNRAPLLETQVDSLKNGIKSGKYPRLGYYWVNINQSNLIKSGLPLIYPKKTMDGNDWDYEGDIERVFVCTEDLRCLLQNGCEVEFLCGDDYLYMEFSEKIRGYDLFGWLTDFMKIKCDQDEYKKNKDPRANDVLREVSKLAMNSLSGKYSEGMHLERIEVIEEGLFPTLFTDEKINQNSIYVIDRVKKGLIVSYKKNGEHGLRASHPVYIGSYIYAYARSYMYDSILRNLGQEDCLYMDTDAVKFCSKHLEDKAGSNNLINALAQPVKMWKEITKIEPRYKDHKIYEAESKMPGSFENELSKNNNKSFIIDKKIWFCGTVDEDGKVKEAKYKLKGVSKRAIFIDDVDNLELNKLKTEADKQIFFSKYTEEVEENNSLSNKEIALKVFEKLQRGDDVTFLTLTFTKDVRNTHRKPTGDKGYENSYKANETFNTVKISYSLKVISPKK